MTNIKKIGLSALAGALAMTSAHAGAISVTGSMEVSYTKGSGYQDTGNPLGQNNEITFTGSTELDNGITVAYKRTTTDTNMTNDSELVFGNILGGTIAMQSTGSPLDGIDNKTPTAFKDAEGMVGSIDDVSGDSGSFGIRYTLSDVAGTGVKFDYNYVPKWGSGDSTGDEGMSGSNGNENNRESHDVVLTGSVPGIEGLSLGAGYSSREVHAGNSREDGTAYATYAYGPVTIGYQLGAVAKGATGSEKDYRNTYAGISYAVSDDLSVSYNKTESVLLTDDTAARIEQDFDSISLSYSMGGMTINVADSDCSNCSYSIGRSQSETTVSLSVAF